MSLRQVWLCMCIRIRSSVQVQLLSVGARLEGVLRTPSPWPSSGLVLLDHPEWCVLRDVMEAQRFPCLSLSPHCCDVLCLSVTIAWWKNAGSKGSRFFFFLQWYKLSLILLSRFTFGFTPWPLWRSKTYPGKSIDPSFHTWCRPHPNAHRNK